MTNFSWLATRMDRGEMIKNISREMRLEVENWGPSERAERSFMESDQTEATQ